MRNNSNNGENNLKRIIDKVVGDIATRPQKRCDKASKHYEKDKLTIDKRVETINHRVSETFYTQEYVNLLKEILGSATKFKKLTDHTKRLIQTDIEMLSHDDCNLKTYLHKSINEASYFSKLFPKQYKVFEENFVGLMDGPDSQRGYRYSLPYKFKEYYNKITQMLIDEGYDLSFASEITASEIKDMINQYMTPANIFDSICVILLKSARDSMFTYTKNIYNDKSMSIIKHQIIYHVYRHFSIAVVIYTLQYRVAHTKRVLPLDSLLRSVRNFILLNHVKITTTKEYKLFTDGVESIFKLYSTSGIFSSITQKTVGNKTSTEYCFPTLLHNQLGRFTQPPRVYRPEKVTTKNLQNYIIPSSVSTMTITAVNKIIDSLNISNAKRFSVNENFLNILKVLDNDHSIQTNRPVPSTFDLSNLETKLNLYDIFICKFDSRFIDSIQEEFCKKNLVLETAFQYRHAVGITTAEQKLMADHFSLNKKLREEEISRKGGITRMTLSEIFTGFPLYFTNKLSTTTRTFAHEYVLSRHIGCLKLLRGEYTSTKTTVAGITHMLRAYYSKDLNLANKLENYIENSGKKRLSSLKLKTFYENNRINYSDKEAVTHFMLISVELQNVFRNGKTKLLLQIDQVASGLSFLAILFRNAELAAKTNVHYVGDTTPPYELAKLKFRSFYEKHMKLEDNKILDLFQNDLSLHKYAMMCFSYNQKQFGRTNDFVLRWVKKFGQQPNSFEWGVLNEISNKYPMFIDSLFPGINQQIVLLNEILRIVVSDSNSLRIRTLDGGIIEWKIFKQKKTTRKSYNPHTQASENYRLNVIDMGEDNTPIIDVRQLEVKFLSYLVHSLDAGVMRQIICLMYEKHNYRVDQLFDCVLLHPNQIENFYAILDHIFSQDVFDDYINTHVFSIWRSSISTDKYQIFDSKVEDFRKNCKNNGIKKFKGNVRLMYKIEV